MGINPEKHHLGQYLAGDFRIQIHFYRNQRQKARPSVVISENQADRLENAAAGKYNYIVEVS